METKILIGLFVISLFLIAGCESNDKLSGEPADIANKNAESPVVPITQSTSDSSCSSNIYNCADFKTHAEAQALYEKCGGVNNDVHQLDRDKDGNACETLP